MGQQDRLRIRHRPNLDTSPVHLAQADPVLPASPRAKRAPYRCCQENDLSLAKCAASPFTSWSDSTSLEDCCTEHVSNAPVAITN